VQNQGSAFDPIRRTLGPQATVRRHCGSVRWWWCGAELAAGSVDRCGPQASWNESFLHPVELSPEVTLGGRHGQANRRIVAADLLGRVHRGHHVRRNLAPLEAEQVD
jgi:hypothetical protein